jgi:hypothetical protein
MHVAAAAEMAHRRCCVMKDWVSMHAGELTRAVLMTAMMNAVKEECWSRDLRLLCLHDGGRRRKVDHGSFVLYLSFVSTSCSEDAK